MNLVGSQQASLDASQLSAIGEAQAAKQFRVLFCAWSELDIASGTPVIVCDLLENFGPGEAEVVTQLNIDNSRRRRINVKHPNPKIRFHARLWPFRRGHRVRNWLVQWGMPLLALQLLRRVRKFRPDCIMAVYAQPHWILATWLVSRWTGLPLIYHVHDTFLEQTARRRSSWLAAWLDRGALTSARVLVLHSYLADYYRHRYGIECTVLRQVVRHSPLPAKRPPPLPTQSAAGHAPSTDSQPTAANQLVIGFSGAIYDNNRRQLADLAKIVNDDPSLRLKIWSDASENELREWRIAGPRIEAAYEGNYERLLQQLSTCDVVYLPLAFFDNPGLLTESLQYAFPTKSLDYLVSGTPILVHCPEKFELSRFFSGLKCGYVLNDSSAETVHGWLRAYRAGQIAPLDEADRLAALRLFSPEENKRLLRSVVAEEVGRANARRAGPPQKQTAADK